MELTYKLPKKYKERWIKALRSADYKQGIGHLRNRRNRYCCLGVAYEANGGTWITADDSFYATIIGDTEVLSSTAARGVRRALRQTTLFYSQMGSVEQHLVTMNDDRNWPFKRIADWIEETL
jgi:hypothetical protein